jgi:hypothetical protein
MQNTIPYETSHHHVDADHRRKIRPMLGVLGGIAYVVAALLLMQVVFRIWIGMW